MYRKDLRKGFIFEDDDPADVMYRIACVTSFLQDAIGADHVKLQAGLDLDRWSREGLAYLLGDISSAADWACEKCRKVNVGDA